MVGRLRPAFRRTGKTFPNERPVGRRTLYLGRFRQVIVKHLDPDHVCRRSHPASGPAALPRPAACEVGSSGTKSGARSPSSCNSARLYGVTAASTGSRTTVVCATRHHVDGPGDRVRQADGSERHQRGITDGCTYRRTRSPRGRSPTGIARQTYYLYPIRQARPGSGFRALPPSPRNAEFTTWYRAHVKRFLRVPARSNDAFSPARTTSNTRRAGDKPGGWGSERPVLRRIGQLRELVRDGAGLEAVEFKARG